MPNHLLRSMRPTSIIAGLDAVLNPLGFRRQKSSWNRRRRPFIDVIDVQLDKAGARLTVNAGVAHPEVYKGCWRTELAHVVQESACIVRARIGDLMEGRDFWWLLAQSDIQNDLVQKVCKHVLPFFDQMHSLEAMERFLSARQVTTRRYPPPVIYLAILKHRGGDQSGACRLLSEFGKRALGEWKARIAEVALELGCTNP